MTPSDDAILSEVEGILKEAEAKVTSERAEGIYKEFQEVETSMWNELGETTDLHNLFIVRILQEESAVDDALGAVGNGDAHLIVGDGTLEGHTPDTLVALQLVAEGGDVYQILDDKYLSLSIASDDDIVGVLLRLAAKGTSDPDTPEERKVDVTTTVMLMADHVYIGVRDHTKPDEPLYQTIHADDYEGGDKLVNAMLKFFIHAKVMFSTDREVMEAFLQDLSRQREKEESNNNQQSKEDNQQ